MSPSTEPDRDRAGSATGQLGVGPHGLQNHASVTQVVSDTTANAAQMNCRGPTRNASGPMPPRPYITKRVRTALNGRRTAPDGDLIQASGT